MSAVPQNIEPPSRLVQLQAKIAENPALPLTVVFIGLFVITDVVNRAQVGKGFLTPSNVSTTFLYAAILGLMAAGQTLVMLTGGIDLSVATTATTAGFVTSGLGHHSAGFAILVAVGLSAGIGLVNGIGVAVFRANPLIMTLGVSSVTLGGLAIYGQRSLAPLVPDFVRTIGSGRFLTYIPYDLLVWAPVAAVIVLGLRYSGLGRMIYAVGDNQVACRLAGVRVWQVLLLVYVLCGLLSGFAGVLLDGFVNGADLGLAAPLLLPSVAAVVIGGTSIFGGHGGYGGTVLGALILTVLQSLLTILNAPEWTREVLYGAIILTLAALYARASGRE
jgi:ribose transport system permease protein